MSLSDDRMLGRYLEDVRQLSVQEQQEMLVLINRVQAGLQQVEPDPTFRASLGVQLRHAGRQTAATRAPIWSLPSFQLPWTAPQRSVVLEESIIPLVRRSSGEGMPGNMPMVVMPHNPQYRIEFILGAALLAGVAWWMRSHPEHVPAIKLPSFQNNRQQAA